MARLFEKEKDIFLKVINAILVLVLIFSVVIAIGTGIKLVNKGQTTDYKTYKNEVCMLDEIPTEEIDVETTKNNCYSSYIETRKSEKEFNSQNIDNFLVSISSIVILSLFIHILNRRK